jgi:hypothetical protein
MATANPTPNMDVAGDGGSVLLFVWTLTSANADGAPVEMPPWADRCWQAFGTWGGATLSLEGSNDGVNWFVLSNAAAGTAATQTANGGKQTIEAPRYTRPNLTVPGAGASVTVSLLLRRNQPMRT